MATGTLTKKDEFKNTTSGWIGVVLLDGRGDHKGFPVGPGDSVWLSEDEQIATANAPRSDDDNPFLPHAHPVFNDDGDQVDTNYQPALKLVTSGADVKNRRPFGVVDAPIVKPASKPVVTDSEETGAAPEPEEEPEQGSNAPGEEVATPQARRRRRATT